MEQGLRRRLLEGLGLARRGGAVLAGEGQLRAAVAEGRRLALLFQAADGAPDACRRIAALLAGANPDLCSARLFSAAELGRTLGRERQVHVAVAADARTGGGLAARLQRDLDRLAGFLAPEALKALEAPVAGGVEGPAAPASGSPASGARSTPSSR